MADGSRDDEGRDYDWLYGDGGRSGSSGSRGTGRDPEPTRVMPTMPRGGSGSSGASRSGRPGGPSGPSRPGGSGGGRILTPPSRTRRPWLRYLKIFAVAYLVFLLVVPIVAWFRVERVDDQYKGDRPSDQSGNTYLLVGSDSREDLSAEDKRRLGTGFKVEGQRTDTILLLHTGKGPSLLLSLPRDSIVDIPGYGTNKINAAFAYGGADLLVKTIEQNTGIQVDDYVQVGLLGLVNVVDALGGIQICPTMRMKDKLANLDIKRGCQEADGVTALGYSRSRHLYADGDIGRAQAQREVISAIGHKVLSPWTFLNPVRYVRLALAGSDSLGIGEHTNAFDVARFGFAMTRVNGDSGLTCSVPIADLAVTWDPVRAPRLFKYIQNDDTSDIPHRLCTKTGLR